MVFVKGSFSQELQKRQSPDGGTGTTQQTRGSGGDASQQKGIPPSNIPGKPLENTGGQSQAPNPIESTTTSQISTVTSGEDVKRVLSEPNRIRDEHDHDMPPSRTVTHNTTGFNTTTTIQDGESGAKSGESDAISLDMVANKSSDSNIKSEEKMNSELRNEWKESISGDESESREQQNGKSSATKAKDIVVNANPVSAGRLTEQHDGESRIESKEKSAVRAITQGPKSNPNEQHMLNSEPVQS
ncbi:WRKY transcription factor [Salix suchowensis]|nr:WRKY transcription factor [Salix suchowensis]